MEEDVEEMTSPLNVTTNYVGAINQLSSSDPMSSRQIVANTSKCNTIVKCAEKIYKRHSFDDNILYCRKDSVKKNETFDDLEVIRRKCIATQNGKMTQLSQIHLLQDTKLLDCLIESLKQKKRLEIQINCLKSKIVTWKR